VLLYFSPKFTLAFMDKNYKGRGTKMFMDVKGCQWHLLCKWCIQQGLSKCKHLIGICRISMRSLPSKHMSETKDNL